MIMRDHLQTLREQFTNTGTMSVFTDDTRALSVTVDHALGILILLIITGVFIGSVSSTFTDQQETVTEQELDRISEEVAATLTSADRLAQTGELRQEQTSSTDPVTAVARTSLPPAVTSNTYNIQITEAAAGEEVLITVSTQQQTVEKTITLNTDINRAAGNGDLVVTYDGDAEELTVEVL